LIKKIRTYFDQTVGIQAGADLKSLLTQIAARPSEDEQRRIELIVDEMMTVHRNGASKDIHRELIQIQKNFKALEGAVYKMINKKIDPADQANYLAAALMGAKAGLGRVKGYRDLQAFMDAIAENHRVPQEAT